MEASPEIQQLIQRLARLPGLGPRSARRAALALLESPQSRLVPLAQVMMKAAKDIKQCRQCGNLDSSDPCSICQDFTRNRELICVVETVGDVWALEKAGLHRGYYQVLGGNLSALGGKGPEDLNLSGLMARIQAGTVREVILALSATVEGATTSHWLQGRLQGAGIKITRLGRGVPMGGSLDNLDEGTLAAALLSRQEMGEEE